VSRRQPPLEIIILDRENIRVLTGKCLYIDVYINIITVTCTKVNLFINTTAVWGGDWNCIVIYYSNFRACNRKTLRRISINIFWPSCTHETTYTWLYLKCIINLTNVSYLIRLKTEYEIVYHNIFPVFHLSLSTVYIIYVFETLINHYFTTLSYNNGVVRRNYMI